MGDIVLRYDGPLLVGERRSERAKLLPLSEALSLAAVCAGLIALSLVILGRPVFLAGAFALAFGVLLFASTRFQARERAVLRFALNFADETLRVNAEPSLRHTAAVTVVSFNEVKDVVLTPKNTLEVTLESNRTLLLAKATEPDNEAAQTVRRILRDAFGIRPPSSPPAT
ncbi:MAG: hypothetical protein ACT4TC_07820 [Myxococcaceae bacterium]